MNEQTIRQNVAKKLTAYRKRANLTQSELAERLNYSDKSISKWERGDGLPDLLVLASLSELYGVPIDEFLKDSPLKRPFQTQRQRRILITLLSGGLVWFVATVVFFILTLAEVPLAWLCFLAALPVCAIVCTVFAHLWGNTLLQLLAVSILVWALAVLTHLVFLQFFSFNGGTLIYVVAAVLQVLVLLWYYFMHLRKRNTAPKG